MKEANFIHESAIIEDGAQIGKNNYFGPFCHVRSGVKIGDNNRFESYISIGSAAEHRDYFKKDPGKVEIGNNNIIREFVTINAGTTGVTKIANNALLLRGSHIGHDAIIENNVNLSCNVLIGGHTIVCEYANIGLGCTVHQNRIVGAISMIGMNSAVTNNPLPFVISYGSPSSIQRINTVGLIRAGVLEKDLGIFENWFLNIKAFVSDDLEIEHEFSKYLLDYKQKILQNRNKHIKIK